MSPRIPQMLAVSVFAAFTNTLFAAGKIAPKNDGAAKALAALLVPLGLTPAGDPNGLTKVRAQLVKVLEAMEISQVKAGPGATELLNTAYRYRPEVGPVQRAAAAATLSNAWRDARAMGLFDDKHHFTGKISKGADLGQNVVFEYIVPASLAKEFAQDLTNIRIAPPTRSRITPTAVTHDDEAYIKTLASVSREISGMKKLAAINDGGPRNSLGQTPEQARKIWQAEMDQDGEKSMLMPDIILKGYVFSTPVKKGDDAWHLQAKVTNLSLHPTEVEVQCWVVGATWKKHENFLMLEAKQTVQLRRGQEELVDFTTLAQTVYKERSDDYENLDKKKERPKSHVYYRGTIFRVVHKTGNAASVSTEDSLIHLIEDGAAKSISQLPNFFIDPKAAPKK